jgi:sugar phosphate permease
VLGGLLADACKRRWAGGRVAFVLAAQLVFIPISLLFYRGEAGAWYFLPAWVLTNVGFMVWYGAVLATVHELAPPGLRATAVGLWIFVVNVLGAGPGPWILGRLKVQHGWSFTDGLTLSMVVAAAALPLLAVAAARYRRDAGRAAL